MHVGWLIDPQQVQVCHRPDGQEWLLGEGQFGRVYKAIKGVQVGGLWAGGRNGVAESARVWLQYINRQHELTAYVLRGSVRV